MEDSIWTLPRAVLAAACLTLPGAAWAQQAPNAAPQEAPKGDSQEQKPQPVADKPLAAPPVVNVGPEGFTLSSADKQFQLKLRGYVQADGRLFLEGKDRPGGNTFLVRRARPIIEGTLFGWTDFRIMPDFGGGTTVLQDAYVDLRPLPELRLRAGKYKPPTGLEQFQSDTNIVFVERGLPADLVPNRDVGIQLHGDVFGGVLSYVVGVFNGVPDGASADLNSEDNVDLAARLFTHPFRKSELRPLQGLGFGISVNRGSLHGTQLAPAEPVLRTEGQQVFFSYLTGATLAETVIADGEHLRLIPQAYYFWGPFGLLAEYVSSAQQVRRGADADRLRNQAWQVQASYVLFGGNASFEGVRPTRPFKPSEGNWGAVEVAARAAQLRIDPDAFPRFADPNRSARLANDLGVAANWYLGGNSRIAASLERTTFEGGAADGGNRPTELELFARFQASF